MDRKNPGRRRATRPLAEDVEHFMAFCPVHGETLHARHRAGLTRNGRQRFNDRCLICHSTYNLAHPAVSPARTPAEPPPAPAGPPEPRRRPAPSPTRVAAREPGVPHTAAVTLRRDKVIHPEDCHTKAGRDLVAGDVLPSGVILEASTQEEYREVRLEMVGANIHYVGYDEQVTVLCRVDRDVLDAVSVGAFIAARG